MEEYSECDKSKVFRKVFNDYVIKSNQKKWKIFADLKKYGYTIFSFDIMCLCLQKVLEQNYADFKTDLLRKLKEITPHLKIQQVDSIKVFYKDKEILIEEKEQKISKELISSEIFCSFVEKIFRDFVSLHDYLIIILRKEKPFFRVPSICVYNVGNIKNKYELFFDRIISKNEISLADIKRVLNYFEELFNTKKYLALSLEYLSTDDINKYIREYSLMQYVKEFVKKEVKIFLSKTDKYSCDFLDLEYQVLFRITSYSIAEIFPDADDLIKFTENINTSNAFELYNLPKEFFINQKINTTLLKDIIFEQYEIIICRLKKSKLPIKRLMNFDLFKKRLIIEKESGNLFLKGDNVKYKVSFKKVEKKVAISFHNDLHYIHTPRCEIALGFFIEDEKLPFSVLTIAKIDRQYKSDALIAFGFDPKNCFDFTRLYSLPNAPKNLSSCIFKESFNYLKENYPKFQAALSAFMPSYASGTSMLTGGFDHPIIFKPGRHFFQKRKINKKNLYEHVTKRRFDKNTDDYIESVFPLIPVVELIAVNSKPRLEPLLKLGTDAILIRK